MGKKIAFARVWGATLLAIAVLAGCGGPVSSQSPMNGPPSEEILRTQSDAARGRIWVLGVEDLRVYDAVSNKLVRRVVLPGWSIARYKCPPDLILDASGSAIISNNVVPTLWRVDARSFAVTERAIALEGKEGWDIGFGAIALAGNGSIYALTSNGMSLWKVDSGVASASLLKTYLPPAQACTLPKLARG